MDSEINRLTNIYKKYTDSSNLIIEETDKSLYENDSLEKVSCPECENEIFKNVGDMRRYPNCGCYIVGFSIDYD